jgi:hypothetical protein
MEKLKTSFTGFKLIRTNQVPGMCVQTFHASRAMDITANFKAEPIEFFIICMSIPGT